MAQLNYRPSAIARSLATSSSNMMGLLVTYYTGGFFGEMMEQVQTELDMHHKFLITAQGHHSHKERGRRYSAFTICVAMGMFCIAGIYQTMICEIQASAADPLCSSRSLCGRLEERCITFDHRGASQIVVEHLIQQGHRKIACITGPLHRHNSRLRQQGYLDALAHAGASRASHCVKKAITVVKVVILRCSGCSLTRLQESRLFSRVVRR